VLVRRSSKHQERSTDLQTVLVFPWVWLGVVEVLITAQTARRDFVVIGELTMVSG